MSDAPILPGARAAFVNPDGTPSRAFYDYLRRQSLNVNLGGESTTQLSADVVTLAQKLGADDGKPASITTPIFKFSGFGGITATQDGRSIQLTLADLPDSGTGSALVKITRDAKGRVGGTQAATISDLSDVASTAPTDGNALVYNATSGEWEPGSGGGTWGSITGTLSDQADLQAALDAKVTSAVPGNHISVDATDPKNPVINVTGLSAGAGYAEGTSFPASPGLNDKFYRADLNLLCYHDGTRWLTVQEYERGPSTDAASTTTGNAHAGRWNIRSDHSIYLTRFNCTTYLSGTNNASNYWEYRLQMFYPNVSQTQLASTDTSANAGSSFVQNDVALAVDAGTGVSLLAEIIVHGSPGLIIPMCSLCYRLVVT